MAMMSLFEVDAVQIEKEIAMRRHRSFKKVAGIARTLEFCCAVVFLPWLISRSSGFYPAVVEFCGGFLRRMCVLALSHHFVFLAGNLIIVALFAMSSGRCVADDRRSAGNADEDLIQSFAPPVVTLACDIAMEQAKNDEKLVEVTKTDADVMRSDPEVLKPVEVTKTEADVLRSDPEVLKPVEVTITDADVMRRDPEVLRSRRTKSEDFKSDVTEKIQLRRSETELRLDSKNSGDELNGERATEVEDLSNEEFQRKVEAFIERHRRFMREESSAMVMCN